MQPKFVVSLLAAALMLPLSAFAANKNSSNVEIPEKVVVNGQQLTPGTYKVEWNGTAPNVEVSILQGHKTVAQAPAQIVNGTFEQQAIVTHQNKSGANVLDQIQLKNKELNLSASSGANSGNKPATTSGS
jgi:maltodextrin utilization protein YvdJ